MLLPRSDMSMLREGGPTGSRGLVDYLEEW